ncbi:MAG: replicative DNA helicase [Oscillospiraceae bacterium]|nr:replicative DNA helicase [Oscillospiraceae bacterium]
MDEIRKLPHNAEAEQAVIGSMLLDPSCVHEVVELVGREDFYLTAHQSLFDALNAMFLQNEAVDPVTLMGKMREQGTYDEASTRAYIGRLLDLTPTAAHVKHYAGLVREAALLRRLENAASEISLQAREPGAQAEGVLEYAEKSIYDVREGREAAALHSMPSVLMDVYQDLKKLAESGGKLPGVSCGITALDEILGGLLDNNLIIVASRPGVGKTSMILNFGLHAARVSGKSAVFFSLEMSKEQLVSRVLAGQTGINLQKLRDGNLSTGEWQQLGEASGALMGLPFWISETPAITVESIKAKCRRVKNLGLVIVDYLQLVQVPKSKEQRFENRVSEVGHISRNLKIMSKELGIPVICAAQLRREAERGSSKRPMLSDLRESGNIEQDADSVVLLHREYANNPDADPTAAECIIAKNRHGRTGLVELFWRGDVTTFTQKDAYYD